MSGHTLVRAGALLGALALVGMGHAQAPAVTHVAPRPCPVGTTPHPLAEQPLRRPQWLARTVVTEYWPVPERWFVGKLVPAPGLSGLHRVDWLYGGHGLPMEGDGVGLDGRRYHFGGPWHLTWVNSAGRPTLPCTTGNWSDGPPYWPDFGWRNAAGAVTFPLAGGGWSAGPAARTIALPPTLRFLPGPSLPLRYWHSLAVDPRLIPLGSHVFIPAYCSGPNRGWFTAADTGGLVISGRHVDVYRPPPPSPEGGRMLSGQTIYVVPHGRRTPKSLPNCPG